jgi:hypothetical protein
MGPQLNYGLDLDRYLPIISKILSRTEKRLWKYGQTGVGLRNCILYILVVALSAIKRISRIAYVKRDKLVLTGPFRKISIGSLQIGVLIFYLGSLGV